MPLLISPSLRNITSQWSLTSTVLKPNLSFFRTTFLKARLNCSIPGDYPFYFNEIQSVHFLKSESIVYAAFTTPENSIAGSAVCSFNLTAVEDALNGPFKKQSKPDSAWGPVSVDHSHFQCKSSQSHQNANSREYQLVDQAVKSSTVGPLYHVRTIFICLIPLLYLNIWY